MGAVGEGGGGDEEVGGAWVRCGFLSKRRCVCILFRMGEDTRREERFAGEKQEESR